MSNPGDGTKRRLKKVPSVFDIGVNTEADIVQPSACGNESLSGRNDRREANKKKRLSISTDLLKDFASLGSSRKDNHRRNLSLSESGCDGKPTYKRFSTRGKSIVKMNKKEYL